MKREGHVEFYKSRTGWRWRIVAANGRIIANGGQGYSRRIDCENSLSVVTMEVVAWDWTTR